jgi:hypothetical protein
MKFKVVVVSLGLFLPLIPAIAATPPKSGAICSKVGVTQNYMGKKFTCIKSGKKLIWDKGVLIKKSVPAISPTPTPTPTTTPTPTPTTTPTPTPTYSPTLTPTPTPSPTPVNTNVVTEATRFIQSLIDNTPITNTKNKTKIVMHIEPGNNGPYPEISENALNVALNFYASVGIVLPQDTIHVLLGRTQTWLREQANIYAPGCVDSSYKFDGNASLCANPNRSAIYSHLPTAVTMNASAPDNIDLSNEVIVLKYTNKKIVDSFAGASPHEAHHAWQDGNYGNGKDVPKWLWEGGASIFGEMVYAKMQTPKQTYLTLDPGLTGWGKGVCIGPIETMKPVCEYTQGIVVMEYFLYKFGVDSYIKLITQGNNLAFPLRFENATKTSLTSFYSDVNKYLTLKGWNY